MKRLHLKFFLCFLAFVVPLVAYDFKACERKAELSMERVGNTYGIAIRSLEQNASKVALFVYSPKTKPQNYKILKHDPFVGMYLLEPKGVLEPIDLKTIQKEILEDEMASVTPSNSVSGKIATRMQSPIDFATLNTPTFQNSLISTVCDHIYGIGIGKNAFIEKEYLERFLKSDWIYYGDIGVRVVENGDGEVEVSVIDPFFKNNPFMYGDVIVFIDGEEVANLASFHRIVFDLTQNSIIPVQVKRNGVLMEVFVEVDRLRGGMLLPEDFFSRVHLDIDNDFVITYVGKEAKDGFERLRVGDKVLRVNQCKVPSGYDAIIHLLGEYPDKQQQWLISRDNFQFFIDVNVKDRAEQNTIEDLLMEGLLRENNGFSF